MSRFTLVLPLIAGPMLLTGCQTWTSEMTLPSPTYVQSAPQYIPPAPNNPLPKELTEPEAATQPMPPQLPGTPAANLQPTVATPPTPPQLPGTPSVNLPPNILTQPMPPQLPGTGSSNPQATTAAPAPPTQMPMTPSTNIGPTVDDPYVAELLDVIEKTKSMDALLVTAAVLAAEKPNARQVVPTLIRNAERLGIYGRYALDKDAPEIAVVNQFTDLVLQISKDKAARQRRVAAAAPPPKVDAQVRPSAARPEDFEPVVQSIVEAPPAPKTAIEPRFQPTFRIPPPRGDSAPHVK